MDISTLPYLIGGGVVSAAALYDSIFLVRQKTSAVVERFGRFHTVREAGINIKLPWIDRVIDNISLRIHQLDVEVETKTGDNVFVTARVSVQYRVLEHRVRQACYSLENPAMQIESYVFDVVRSEIPKMNLDEVFSNKDQVAASIRAGLSDSMREFGFDIVNSLVTDLQPEQSVKDAMNRINAAEREKAAAENEAAAHKIRLVRAAEAEAESKRLQGRGLAHQRLEIAHGIRESIETIKETGVSEEEVMTLLLVTQHYDAIQDVARHSGTNTVLMNYSPSGISDVATQIREAVLSVNGHGPGALAGPDSDPVQH